MLDSTLALKLAARLAVVREFPRYLEAIEAVAADLIDLTRTCDDTTAEIRAYELVEEIRRTWDEWSGESDLFRMYQKKFGIKREVKSEDNEVKNYGQKPAIECKSCNDTGAVKTESGRYDWCNCITGVNLHFDMPGWLDLLNAERVIPQPEPVKPHPAAEKPISAEIEKTLVLNPECQGCLNRMRGTKDSHTHAEFWKYHCKQEIPANGA